MKKKLLIIVPNLCLGGQERVAVNTAEIMKSEYDVTLLIFDDKNAAYETSCKVVNISVPASGSYVGKIINVLRRIAVVKKYKKANAVDYSISYGLTANIVNVFSRGKDKSFISIRGYRGIGTSLLDKYLYKKCDGIIACSKEMQETIKGISKEASAKTSCLYNPYDIEKIIALGEEPVDDYGFTRPTIVTHGRLSEVKNYARLIKAFSVVKEQVPESQLLIIGEGDERPNLEKLISELNLEEDVCLIGFKSNPFKYIARSTVYALSSKNEGFPNALVEGMCFLPVVAVDCKTGPAEILDGTVRNAKYGILIEQDIDEDGRKLAEGLIQILTDEGTREYYREKAKERVKDFSYEVYRDELNKIIKVQG